MNTWGYKMFFNCIYFFFIKYEINKYNQINLFMQPDLKLR